jgi:Lipid A 3-O-deacylase (PagL)
MNNLRIVARYLCWMSGIIACFPYTSLVAQHVRFDTAIDTTSRNHWVWLASVQPSRFWKHTPKLSLPASQEWLPTWEVGIQCQTRGRKNWHVAHRYPALGVSVLRIQTGATRHEAAWAILPHLDLPLVRRPAWALNFRVATGIARVNRPYETFDWTGSNALGSRWNNCTAFRLGARVRLSPNWLLEAGGGLTHLSNGAYELPNFGINLPGLYATALYARAGSGHFNVQKKEVRRAARHTEGRRWGAWLQWSGSQVEYLVLDGPKHTIRAYSGALTWRVHDFNVLSLAYERERHAGVYAWGLHNGYFPDRASAERGATRHAVVLGDEFRFGDISVLLQVGRHVGPSSYNQWVLTRTYSRLSARYYLPIRLPGGTRLYGGVGLKAYKGVAEYIGLQVGFSI